MSERVPEGWKLSKIAEISSILDSKRVPLNSQERAKRVGEYPYYGANGVQGYIDDFIFEGEHVLLAEDGGNFEQWATRPISYLVDGKFWVNNHAHILKAKKNHSTKFIHYSLVHKNILKHINGGTRAKLNQADMRDIQVLCPPLPEQQKIAKILTSVDEVIEKTQAQIDKLKDLKTGMMQELLTQGVGVDGKPHTEFKDSSVGRIPKAWDLEPLANFTTFISYGFTNPMPEAEVGPYMITAKDVNDLKVQYSTARKTTQEAFDNLLTRKSRPQVNDILLTKDGTLGRVALVTDSNCCINQSVAVLTPNERVIPKFLLYLLASPRYQQEMLENAGGSTIKHIYITVVDKMLVGVPSVIEQQKLVDIFDSVFRKLELAENKLSKLNDTKKALMQDLLTGKVRVTID
jgi:type I restriction enzyme S subunit